MRSFSIVSGENALAQQFTNLRHDAHGAGNLLVHQQLGALALGTAPTNGQTVTLTINGTAIVFTAVGTIGTAAGNVLNPGTAAGFVANLIALILQPQTTTATGVALLTANQQLLSYLSWPLSGTTITPSRNNTSLYAPLTSFLASTTVTSGSYTASTLRLYVEPGVVYVGGTRVIFSGASTPAVTAPSSNPRIDVLTVDSSGTLAWTTGTENASPVAPTYLANKVALCELYNVVGETALYDSDNQQSGQGYISTDVRPMIGTAFNPLAVASNIIADVDGTRDMGSNTIAWNNIYGKIIHGDGSNLTSIQTVALALNATATESISAGAPVAAAAYMPLTLDTGTVGSFNSTGVTQAFAVGNNSNRILIVMIANSSDSADPVSTPPTYGGVNMTQIDGSAHTFAGSIDTFYLVAPATGSNNLVFSGLASANYTYAIYSYYNAAQSSQPDNHIADTSTSGTSSFAKSLTPNKAGCLVVGFGWGSGTSPAFGGVANNTHNGGTTPKSFAGGSGAQTTIASVTGTITQGSGNAGVALVSIAPITLDPGVQNASSAASNQRSAAFIGFAKTSASAGQAITVITGGYVSGLSGLTPISQYYLNDTYGTIGTSPGSVTRKVGIAISSTELMITNIW